MENRPKPLASGRVEASCRKISRTGRRATWLGSLLAGRPLTKHRPDSVMKTSKRPRSLGFRGVLVGF